MIYLLLYIILMIIIHYSNDYIHVLIELIYVLNRDSAIYFTLMLGRTK